MPLAVEQPLDLLERHAAQVAREPPRGWNADAEEAVAFAVLSGTRSEESLEKFGVSGIAERAELLERARGRGALIHRPE